MIPKNKTFSPVLLAVWLLMTLTLRADAYMDPGSGALIWQTLAAAGVGILFYFRRAVERFRMGRRQPGDGNGNDSDGR